MKQYLDLVKHVMEQRYREARPYRDWDQSVFGYQMRFDLVRIPYGDYQKAPS